MIDLNMFLLFEKIRLVLDDVDDEVGEIVNEVSPNLTVCPHCMIDDFVHMTNCPIQKHALDWFEERRVRKLKEVLEASTIARIHDVLK